MSINHLVLIGGGHTNSLLMRKWIMSPKLMPEIPITIISRDTHLVYSALFPSVISKSISLQESLIDVQSLAKNAQITFIKDEVMDIDFKLREISLENRPSISYSNLVLNFGSNTRIPKEFKHLVKSRIAFPIKPFYEAHQLIINEDIYDSFERPPFVVVGSGLAAIEVAFALRKRWRNRPLKLLCHKRKMNKKILKSLLGLNISLVENLDFEYGKILLCTGNTSPLWVQKRSLELDSRGRIITDQNLRLRNFSGIFATGDCAIVNSSKRPASGIFAVKVLDTLVINIKKYSVGKTLRKWFPQKFGLQIINSFSKNKPIAFAVYRGFVFGPSFFIWFLKNKIDRNFINKFRLINKIMLYKKKVNSIDDCRGCAAKISQEILNKSLKNASLGSFATTPEDAVEIYKNPHDIILQSVDGFPALISDPWLNSKITTLHACSDLWACGARISSAQALISLPKVEKESQKYLFSQCLEGIKSTVEEQGGRLIGGHTFESRSPVTKPSALDIQISLTVQGVLKNGLKPWLKSGMQVGDILLMSRPLGVGIFFAGQMQNINLQGNYDEIMKCLLTSQQYLIDEIYSYQDQFGESLVNAATDITGYGFMGHLNEMVESSNLSRKKNNLPTIKVLLDLFSFNAYPGILDLIQKNIKSSLFESNKEIVESILNKNFNDRTIFFVDENNIDQKTFNERISLLIDPQTCGPILISCKPKYEIFLKDNWYKVGEVIGS